MNGANPIRSQKGPSGRFSGPSSPGQPCLGPEPGPGRPGHGIQRTDTIPEHGPCGQLSRAESKPDRQSDAESTLRTDGWTCDIAASQLDGRRHQPADVKAGGENEPKGVVVRHTSPSERPARIDRARSPFRILAQHRPQPDKRLLQRFTGSDRAHPTAPGYPVSIQPKVQMRYSKPRPSELRQGDIRVPQPPSQGDCPHRDRITPPSRPGIMRAKSEAQAFVISWSIVNKDRAGAGAPLRGASWAPPAPSSHVGTFDLMPRRGVGKEQLLPWQLSIRETKAVTNRYRKRSERHTRGLRVTTSHNKYYVN